MNSSSSSSENSSVQLTIPSSSTPVHIVVWQEKKGVSSESTCMDTGILERLSALEKMVQQILDMQTGEYTLGSRIPFFPESIHPLPDGIEEIRSVHILEEEDMEQEEDRGEEDAVKEVHVIKLDQPIVEVVEVEVAEPSVKKELYKRPAVLKENIVQIVEAKAVEEVEEEEVEEEEVEEEVEEDGEALEEFEWKGVTYYRDSEKNVYKMDEDGDLQDEPIGRWNEEKQKVVRFAATPAAAQ